MRKTKIIRISAAAILLLLWCLYNWGGNMLVPIAAEKFRQSVGAGVDIKDISFHLSGKVRLSAVRIAPLIKAEPDNAIFAAGRIDIDFSLLSILSFNPRIKELTIRDFTLNAQFNSDTKQWNIAALKIPPGRGGKIPDLLLKRGELKFTQAGGGKETKTADCRIEKAAVEIKDDRITVLLNDADSRTGSRILITRQNGSFSVFEAQGWLGDLDLHLFESRCNLEHFQSKIVWGKEEIVFEKTSFAFGKDTEITVGGTIKNIPSDPCFVFNVSAKDLKISHNPADNSFAHGSRIFDKFIPLLQVFFDNFDPQGILGLDVVLTGRSKEIAKTKCSGYLDCSDISIKYFEFPYLVEHLRGRIDVTETSMTMKDVKASHGAVDIALNGHCIGFGEQMDSRVVLSSGNMLLDNDLYVALLPHHKRLWYIFAPSGVVSGDFIFTASPPNKRLMELYADLLDVSIICHYFPYQIGGITGKIAVKGERIELSDVRSGKGGGEIKMNGLITGADTEEPNYNFKITAQKIPFDKELIDALGSEQKKFFSDFQMAAVGDANIYIHSVDDVNMPVDYTAKLLLRSESIRHPIVPEPLTSAVLEATLTPSAFEINKFDANFRDNPVSASGTIWPQQADKPLGYCVKIKAVNFALDHETVRSVSGEQGVKLIEDYNFSGSVNIEAMVGKNSPIKCPDFEAAVDCLSNTAEIKKLSLPLKDITGRVVIRPGEFDFHSLSASVGGLSDVSKPARITLDGSMTAADGQIESAILKLTGTDIELNEGLGNFLGNLGEYYSKSSPAGAMDLNLDKINFYDDEGAKKLSVGGFISLKDCSIGQDKPVSGIYGLCGINARYQIGSGLEECLLDLDFQNISVRGRPLEGLKMPVVVDVNSGRIIIESFSGNCLGGKASGMAEFFYDEDKKISRYSVDMTLANADTEGLLNPQSARSTDGRTNMQLNMQGNLQHPQDNLGRLSAAIMGIRPRHTGLVSNIRAAIYEAIRQDLLLDNVGLEAVIKGRVVEISRFDIYGLTASLRGSGTYMPAEDVLDVVFTAYAGAGKDKPGFFESATAGLGAAFLKVELTGGLEQPQIKVIPLPVLRKSMQILGKRE